MLAFPPFLFGKYTQIPINERFLLETETEYIRECVVNLAAMKWQTTRTRKCFKRKQYTTHYNKQQELLKNPQRKQ